MSRFLEMYFTVLSYLQFCLSATTILTYLFNIFRIYFARLYQYQNTFFVPSFYLVFFVLLLL